MTPQSSLKRLGTFEGVLPRRRTEIHLQSAVPICAGYRLAIWSICLWLKNGEKNGNTSKKRWMKHLNVLLKKKHSEECGWMKCWSHAWKRYLKRLAFIETFGEFRKKTFHLFWWTFVRGARDFDISIYDADPWNELQGPVACASEHFFVWLYEDHEDQWARVSLQIAMCALVFFGAQDVSHLLTCVTRTASQTRLLSSGCGHVVLNTTLP